MKPLLPSATAAPVPALSKLEPCREFILEMRERGATYSEITTELMLRYHLRASISSVCQFTRRDRAGNPAIDPTPGTVVRLRDSGRSCAEIVRALRAEHGITVSRETVLALMRGNPFQSKLEPHRELVFRLWRKRWTYAEIAAELQAKHGLRVSLATIYSFIKVRLPRAYPLSPAARTRRANIFVCVDLQPRADAAAPPRLRA